MTQLPRVRTRMMLPSSSGVNSLRTAAKKATLIAVAHAAATTMTMRQTPTIRRCARQSARDVEMAGNGLLTRQARGC